MSSFWYILSVCLLYAAKVSSSGDACVNECLANANFTEAVEKVGYCARGCRLMQLIDSVNSDNGNMEALLQVCHQSCATAYVDSDLTATAACQYGCSAQLSAVMNRREQLAMMYQEAMEYAEVLQWATSFMSCFQSNNGAPGRNLYVRTRIFIINSAPNKDDLDESAEGSSLMLSEEESNWVVQRISNHELPPRSTVIVFGGLFFVLILFTIVLCCPGCYSSKPRYSYAKLSIYGDGEHLKTLDEADEELLIMEKKPIAEPQLLLMKIPIHSV